MKELLKGKWTGINVIPFFNLYLKSLQSIQFVKKNAYLPTHTHNSESGDSKQIIF